MTILQQIDLRIEQGATVAIVGSSGSGKSTFMNILGCLDHPTEGDYWLDGEDVSNLDRDQLADIRNRKIGFVFQQFNLVPHLSVLENVRIALQRRRGGSFDFWRSTRSLDQFNERALKLIEDVGLSNFVNTTAVELAYGRKRALEIATTLALDPEMLLLDESTAGMGHEDIDRIAALIKRVAADRTVLMVEHNMNVVASIADTISVLQRGQLIAEGPYDQVSKDPQVLEAYMGSAHTELQGAH